MDATEMLDEFHDALGDERGRGNAQLRVALHTEEHKELIEALGDCREGVSFSPGVSAYARRQLARELADVIYVAYGTAHAFAIDLDAALREVHRAAMSKIVRANGEPPVIRADGKVLKPPEFVPPDMTEATRD